MAYTAQTVTSSGTELDFLTAVRTFFVNNQDITFTVEEEDLTNYPQYFIVSVNSKLIANDINKFTLQECS